MEDRQFLTCIFISWVEGNSDGRRVNKQNLIDKMAAGEDLLTAEEEIQAEKAAEWAAKKAAKEAQQNL